MTDNDAALDLLKMMEEAAHAAAALGGMRQQLISQGFTPEQAGDLIVELLRQNRETSRD